MKHNFVRGFISIFTSRIMGTILGVLITPILTRILGSSQYGEYAFLMSIMSLTMVVVNSGLFDGIRKYSAENRAIAKWHEQVFKLFMMAGISSATIASILLVTAGKLGVINRLFAVEEVIYLYLLAGLVLSQQISIIVRGMLHGINLEHFAEPLKIIKQLIFAVVGILLALFGFGVSGVLMGEIIGGIVSFLIGMIILTRYLDWRQIFKAPPNGLPIKEMISFNSMSTVINILFVSLYNIDILILKYYLPSQEVGYYKGALVVAEFLWFPALALQVVLVQSTSGLWVNQDHNQISNIASKVTNYNLLLTIILVIGIGVLADSFIPIYFGEEYVPAIIPLIVLLPGVLGYAIAKPIIAIGQGKGDLRILIISTASAAVINLLLNIILIPRLGIMGAAIGTSIGYFSMIVFNGRASYRIGFNPFHDVRLVRTGITAICSGALIFLIDSMINSDILSLIIIPPIGFGAYIVIAIKFKAIAQGELIDDLRQAPSPIDHHLVKIYSYIEQFPRV